MERFADRFRSEMAANPHFWRDFNQNAPICRNMIEGVQRFWADHQFEEIGRRLEQASAERRAEIEQLNQKKEQIQKSKEGINNALIYGLRQIRDAIKKYGDPSPPPE